MLDPFLLHLIRPQWKKNMALTQFWVSRRLSKGKRKSPGLKIELMKSRLREPQGQQ